MLLCIRTGFWRPQAADASKNGSIPPCLSPYKKRTPEILKTPGGSQEVEKRQKLPAGEFPRHRLRHFAPISSTHSRRRIRKIHRQPFFRSTRPQKKLHSGVTVM
jgi:hypothetical protein